MGKCTAVIGLNHSWVQYENSNDGEENHYRDVYDFEGNIQYMDGETCEIIAMDENTVTLMNDCNEYETFIISREQFDCDFVL